MTKTDYVQVLVSSADAYRDCGGMHFSLKCAMTNLRMRSTLYPADTFRVHVGYKDIDGRNHTYEEVATVKNGRVRRNTDAWRRARAAGA